jgi:hypothetical protein
VYDPPDGVVANSAIGIALSGLLRVWEKTPFDKNNKTA